MTRLLRWFHVHWFRYVKTGVDFTYELDELDLDDPLFPYKVFAGPIVHAHRCRCGATKKVPA